MTEPKKILIIDDEAFIRRILGVALSEAGHRIISADSGEKGLELIGSEAPEVVITDIRMPSMSGRELCEATDPIKAERPFLTIVITGYINPDDRDWIGTLRDTLFMEKPFSPAKILRHIDTYFEQASPPHPHRRSADPG